ncbi:hypothetical protein OC846_000763 [Tilletia horrida]|uniref:Uncharacterized protein n=1 Tax=Tilletia horrida TaxID=155126 RepID=A0AAN6GXF4_9BASI|nr:hypothetical protein OC845_000998 [Tilletia horrida]KAK0557116.1 hypothetical protein OC846_000763 [Tilletia horrida]KAK0560490.1 hypothetical protein OC861_006263 [Tilletia horrida]
MGNGNRAQQKRERNAKDAKKDPKSQLKTNEAAKNVKCSVCFQTFLSTVRQPALEQHSEKHSKPLSQCFPEFVAA